jgi:hypothetical protein
MTKHLLPVIASQPKSVSRLKAHCLRSHNPNWEENQPGCRRRVAARVGTSSSSMATNELGSAMTGMHLRAQNSAQASACQH